jgi:ribokinase
VVVKLGAGGCYIFEKGRGLRVPGFKVKVEDTSAAGDVFNAAFTYGLLHRATFSHAALLANAAAAIKVTELGGGEEAASERQLKGFLKGRSVSMNLG